MIYGERDKNKIATQAVKGVLKFYIPTSRIGGVGPSHAPKRRWKMPMIREDQRRAGSIKSSDDRNRHTTA